VIVAITVLRVPRSDAELAADRLMVAGAFAVEQRDGDGGLVELRATLGEDSDVVADLLGHLPQGWHHQLELVDCEPLDTWREFAAPIEISHDLVIRPAWLRALDRRGLIELAIEPASAFGLGDHPTTRLSAAAVWRAVGEGDTILDVGCGTGALAIAGVLRGARRALAIDIAEPAVRSTRDNAERNGVGDRIDASTMPLADVVGQFDVVVANILAPALIELAGDLRRTTVAHGCLIVSGVLAGGYDHVVRALAPMDVVEVTELDGWAALELRHPR
jgi:ribosomal protein L11 methyltransferase